jgi:hypothetical protein
MIITVAQMECPGEGSGHGRQIAMIMQRSRELGEQKQETLPQAPPQAQPTPVQPFAGNRPVQESPTRERTRVQLVTSIAEYRVRQVIWLLVAVIDAIVGLDFVFRLVAASDTGVAHLIFVSGSWLAGPFDGIFASVPRISGLTLRWSDLLVIVLASVAGWGVVRVAGLSGRGRRQRIVERVVA